MNEIKIDWKVPQVLAHLNSEAHSRMVEAVHRVREETNKTLSGERTGRTYVVPGTHKKYRASAPGEAPAARTGELRQAVTTEVTEERGEPVGYVGLRKGSGEGHKPEEYGLILEKGNFKIRPRPWLEPSFEKSRKDVQRIFERSWEDPSL